MTEQIKSWIMPKYSIGEELASSIIHGIGMGLSGAGLAILVVLSGLFGDAWRITSFSVYGGTLILMYTASTFYHSFQNPKIKRIFRIFDHIAIFLLIAGTYTPFTLVSLRGAWGWTLFGLIWGLALFGIFLTVAFPNRLKALFLGTYVAMGWLIIIAIKPMLEILPNGALMWLLIGGACYTSGIIFYVWKKLPYNHAIWHVFVLGGSICHFLGILWYVLPMDEITP